MEKIKPSDIRRHKFFIIDNEIIDDYGLCPVGITMYCNMVRFSKNDRLFFSVSKFCSDFKVGKSKALKIFKDLEAAELFEVTGKTAQGCRILNLLPIEKIALPVLNETAPVLNETATGSKQNPNNTYITRHNKQENNIVQVSETEPEPQFNLYNYVKNIFHEGYKKINNGKILSWEGIQGAKNGTQVKAVIKMGKSQVVDPTDEKQIAQEIRERATILLKYIMSGHEFFGGFMFEPWELSRHWNKLAVYRTKMSKEQRQEIEEKESDDRVMQAVYDARKKREEQEKIGHDKKRIS